MRQTPPFFSIIIPTYNRPQNLAVCLNSLTHLKYPHDRFEAIVVDDGSKEAIDSIISQFHNKLNIVLIVRTHSGPAAARNAGAAQAKGDFLVFADDDCKLSFDFLARLAARLIKSPQCIGGRTVNALPQNLYSTASQLLIDYLYAYHERNPTSERFFASNNLIMPIDCFRSIGGFNVAFPRAAAEDREFCDRLQQQGYQLTYAQEILVYHYHELTFWTFCRQHFNYGRGAFCFHRIRAWRFKKSLQLRPISFYFDLIRFPFLNAVPRQALILSILLMISQLSNAAGFFLEWLKQVIGNVKKGEFPPLRVMEGDRAGK